MYTVTQTFHFSYGHRILGHEGKCRYLHGHNGVAEVTVRGANGQINSMDMVVDFAKLKEVVGGWIDKNWDHNFLVKSNDPLVFQEDEQGERALKGIVGDRQLFIMPDDMQPTAEAMAKVLYTMVEQYMKPFGIRPICVTIRETERCLATYGEPGKVTLKIVEEDK